MYDALPVVPAFFCLTSLIDRLLSFFFGQSSQDQQLITYDKMVGGLSTASQNASLISASTENLPIVLVGPCVSVIFGWKRRF